MANKELQAALNILLETQRISERDVTDDPPETRNGLAVLKQVAINELPIVRKYYTDLLTKHIVKVFIKGNMPELEAYLKKEGGIVLNGNLLYNWLIENLAKPSVFGPQHTIQVMELLAEFCKANEIESIPMPYWDGADVEVIIGNDVNKLVNIIKKAVRVTNKDDITKFVLTKYAFLQAINDKVAYNLVPVVIFNLDPEEITGLSDALFNGQQSVVVDVNGKKFDEVVVLLNQQLQAANTALKRVTKENTNE